MTANPILTRHYRGGRLESSNRGSWVVVRGDEVVDSGGTPDDWYYPRSGLKPLQMLPVFAAGLPRELELSVEERAVLVASHSGDEQHVERVRSVLAKGALPEGVLRCGPHTPIDAEAAARLYARGEEPLRIHNNCSGKHTGFLLRARSLDAPLDGYLDPEHPVQREVRATLSSLTGIPEGDLAPGIDGCGAPNWPVPLRAMAALFRDLANPARLPAGLRDGASDLMAAVTAAPHFFAGRGRFDTALLTAGAGRILGKCGAEGWFALGVRGDPPIGVALKVDDGATRGYESALPWLLRRIGVLEGTESDLAPFYDAVIRNTQGLVVGATTTRWHDGSVK